MKKTTQSIIIAMMFFAVVFRGPSRPGEVRIWFEVYFEIAMAMSLAAVIWQTNRWIASFLILTWVFMFFPSYGYVSYLAGRAVFNGCLWYLVIVMFFEIQDVKALYKAMRVFVYFHAAAVILQSLNIAGWISVPTPTGLMANPLETSALFVMCLPAFMVLSGKWMFLILIPFAGLVIVKQFLGIAALGVGIVVYLAMAHKIYWTIIPAVIVAAAWWIVLDAPGIDGRLYVWDKAIRAWWQHPILGAGIGHWKIVFSKPMAVDGKRWMTTHNEFLQMLFEMGISSAVIFAGYAISIIRKATREMAIPITAIVITAVYSAASFPMHIAPTAMIVVTWLAVLQIVTIEEENGQKKIGS